MKKFYKCKNLYGDSDHIMLDLGYQKGLGYVAMIEPCHKITGGFGILFSSEYFQTYKGVKKTLVSCNRRNVKAETTAKMLLETTAEKLISEYSATVQARGGKKVELCA